MACVLFLIRLVYDFTLDQSFFHFKVLSVQISKSKFSVYEGRRAPHSRLPLHPGSAISNFSSSAWFCCSFLDSTAFSLLSRQCCQSRIQLWVSSGEQFNVLCSHTLTLGMCCKCSSSSSGMEAGPVVPEAPISVG